MISIADQPSMYFVCRACGHAVDAWGDDPYWACPECGHTSKIVTTRLWRARNAESYRSFLLYDSLAQEGRKLAEQQDQHHCWLCLEPAAQTHHIVYRLELQKGDTHHVCNGCHRALSTDGRRKLTIEEQIEFANDVIAWRKASEAERDERPTGKTKKPKPQITVYDRIGGRGRCEVRILGEGAWRPFRLEWGHKSEATHKWMNGQWWYLLKRDNDDADQIRVNANVCVADVGSGWGEDFNFVEGTEYIWGKVIGELLAEERWRRKEYITPGGRIVRDPMS